MGLLAKKGFRLLHNTHSLVFRVYKAKYFPNSTFIDAPVPRISSYTWSSIGLGKDVINMG